MQSDRYTVSDAITGGGRLRSARFAVGMNAHAIKPRMTAAKARTGNAFQRLTTDGAHAHCHTHAPIRGIAASISSFACVATSLICGCAASEQRKRKKCSHSSTVAVITTYVFRQVGSTARASCAVAPMFSRSK